MATAGTQRNTRLISTAVLLVIAVVTVRWREVGLGVMIGAVGGILMFLATLRLWLWLDDRDRLPRAPVWLGGVLFVIPLLAVPGAIAWGLLGARAAVAAAATGGLAVGGFFGRVTWDQVRDRSKLRRLDRALDGNGDVDAALADMPKHYAFLVVAKLAEHERFAETVTYLDVTAVRAGTEHLKADWLIAAHLALGDAAAARRAKEAAGEPAAPFDRELTVLQEARLAIAEGRAADVVRTLGEVATEQWPALGAARAAIRADARAASGDPDGARQILRALATRHGPGTLARLVRQRRPCSDLAAELSKK